MLKLYLVCVVALATTGWAKGDVVSINDIVDLKLELANRLSVTANRTIQYYGTGYVTGMSWEGGVAVGLDSISRTGECNMTFNENSIAYKYSVGQELMATFFSKLTYDGVTGSGYYVSRTNSMDYGYTVSYRRGGCHVALDNLQLGLDNIVLYIKDKSWDTSTDSTFSDFVQQTFLADINNKLQEKYSTVESMLEQVFCPTPKKGSASPGEHQSPTEGLVVLRSFLFEFPF